VLITGENGTGKELVARQIHARSKRRRAAFVAVNCAAIPAELIESELFGHEKGAFTGAHQTRKGCFELADGGTLFLDEVGDMAVEAQAKLLRALQEQVVTRVGGGQPRRVDVRVLAATNQDLEQGIESGSFREDLFYRLRVVPIRVPALRERLDDIELLARHFLAEAAQRNGVPKRDLAAAGRDWLRRNPWGGNVRELRNLCEAVIILSPGESALQAEDFQAVAHSSSKPRDGDFFALPTLEEFRNATEREFIRRKLEENGGNIKRTAERIGIQRSNLYKKLERYGLK
jgi:two-component system nitrogen regulation response regulator NtrX